MNRLERLVRDIHYNILKTFVNYGQKRFLTFAPGVHVIKLFTTVIYGMFVIKSSACPRQAFPDWYNVCR